MRCESFFSDNEILSAYFRILIIIIIMMPYKRVAFLIATRLWWFKASLCNPIPSCPAPFPNPKAMPL